MTALSPGPDGFPIVNESRETTHVCRWPQEVPASNTPARVAALKKRLSTHPRLNLDSAAIEVVAGLFADPLRIRHLADSNEGYDNLPQVKSSQADLYLVEGEVDFERLVPLINPRLGHRKENRLHPMRGAIAEDGRPLAQAEMRFASVEEAMELVSATAWNTLNEKNADYSESILSHEIMTPIEVVLVRLSFDDGTPPVIVASPYDGVSRTVSAAKVALGGVLLSDEFSKPSERNEVFEARLKASFRHRLRTEPAKAVRQFRTAIKTYNEDLCRERPDLSMKLLRRSRSLTVPVRLIVGGEFRSSTGAAHEALPSAIATLQASRHISVNPWDGPAQDAMAAHRMVTTLAAQQLVTDEVVRLVEDRATKDDAMVLFSGDTAQALDDRDLVSPLWRAVGLVYSLTREAVFDAAKRFIRSELGLRRVDRDRYAAILGVLIDEPWRAAKYETLTLARHAWRNFGVLAPDVWSSWKPVVADSGTLTERACHGDDDARITLLVAAGTALIADGVLTRDTGSKVDDGRTDYRGAPNQVLARLANTNNIHGLHQAGAIVHYFRADQQGSDGTGVRDYTYPRLGTDGQSIPDGTGLRALTEGDVFRIADPTLARKGSEQRERERAARRQRPSGTLTHEELNALRRKEVHDLLAQANDLVELLSNQSEEVKTLREHPFGQRTDWQPLSDLAKKIYETVLLSRPPLGKEGEDNSFQKDGNQNSGPSTDNGNGDGLIGIF